MKNIAVLTGAGISAESGISTFRDSNGLWEGYDVMSVASPQGWAKNKKLVLDFYNERRKNLRLAVPNLAHLALAKLQQRFNLCIITQNVDDLHERAGSKNIIHLHGELLQSRSTLNPDLVYPIEGDELNIGDTCGNGSQLRPNIVWFGEEVPQMEKAIEVVLKAEVFIIIGTSLQVYPAASLIHYVKKGTPIYYIDPKTPENKLDKKVVHIKEKATLGVEILIKNYLKEF
jgi:NAD-dependent deacetylase